MTSSLFLNLGSGLDAITASQKMAAIHWPAIGEVIGRRRHSIIVERDVIAFQHGRDGIPPTAWAGVDSAT
ncbi:MAG: hypothetical protein U0V48_17050 [Anaerolineales bacterium]